MLSREWLSSYFFDLSHYTHTALFSEEAPVWEALSHLSQYCKDFSHQGIACEVPEGAFIVNPETVTIGPETTIEPGAYIHGPCIIGKGCTIRHGAYIRGFVITGNHCVIGHATECKNAIFLDHVHAAHFAYVGDSILGNNVNIGAGARCANLRFDRNEVVVHDTQGRKKGTGRQKLGAILGDGVQIGCNAVLNPGTLMGKESVCYPCLNISHSIAPGEVVSSTHAKREVHG